MRTLYLLKMTAFFTNFQADYLRLVFKRKLEFMACAVGEVMNLYIFSKVGVNEVKFGEVVDVWVGEACYLLNTLRANRCRFQYIRRPKIQKETLLSSLSDYLFFSCTLFFNKRATRGLRRIP